MGKIIDTLTTMLTKPPQPQGAATEKITLMPCSQTQATAAGFGFLRANNDKVPVHKIIHRDPQAYEECEDWSLQMTDKERGVLNALVLMQEPGESIETTVEFSSPQVLALEAGVAGFGYILRAGYADLADPGEYEREPVITGLGFDRASEDERKARHTVKICRRGTSFQCGKDPGFHRAQESELKVRKILKICRKTDEEGLVDTLPVADTLVHHCSHKGC